MSHSIKRPKRSADVIGNAVLVMRIATGEVSEPESPEESAAAALGRRGGKKGGKARMDSMSADERKALAIKAARARWSK